MLITVPHAFKRIAIFRSVQDVGQRATDRCKTDRMAVTNVIKGSKIPIFLSYTVMLAAI